ncbi:MAG: type 4a pilus biogenesis protein PilO [Candidatus Omnitrophota bacterium]
MAQSGEQLDKYKNKAINAAIIAIALIIAYNIYKGSLSTSDALRARIDEEEKKSVELEKIDRIDKKISAYKKLLPDKEASLVMDDIVGIAKSSGIKILSVKPAQEELAGDYIKNNFDVSLSAPHYDDLAKFINMLETSGSVYMVDSLDIDNKSSLDSSELTVSLRISSVIATGQK